MKTKPKVGDYVKVKGSYIGFATRDFMYGRVHRHNGDYIDVQFKDPDAEFNMVVFISELYSNEIQESSEEEYFLEVL